MRRATAVCLTIAALTAIVGRAQLPAAPADDMPQRIERGRELFSYWCATCHGSGPGHGGTTALAFKYQNAKPALLEERTDLSRQEVIYYVRHGINIMPFFRKTELSERDLADVADYLARNNAK